MERPLLSSRGTCTHVHVHSTPPPLHATSSVCMFRGALPTTVLLSFCHTEKRTEPLWSGSCLTLAIALILISMVFAYRHFNMQKINSGQEDFCLRRSKTEKQFSS